MGNRCIEWVYNGNISRMFVAPISYLGDGIVYLPLWKIWVRHLGWTLFPIYGKNRTCSKPPTKYSLLFWGGRGTQVTSGKPSIYGKKTFGIVRNMFYFISWWMLSCLPDGGPKGDSSSQKKLNKHGPTDLTWLMNYRSCWTTESWE